MKIKTKATTIDEVLINKNDKKFIPKKPNIIFRTLLKVLSMPEIFATGFKLTKTDMDKLGKKEPCLYLMNHSSFTDLKIASHVLYPKAFNIVCTLDGIVGKKWLMRNLGCVPTRKFVPDPKIVKDMSYCLKTLKTSVLMYPEAGYTFDGTAVTLPDSLGKCIKLLGVPVVMIKTYGAFLRDPLYNNLQKRKVKISANMKYLLSSEDTKDLTVDEINAKIKTAFTFDEFKWQQENGVKICEKFRADGLDRVLYKCPACKTENQMVGLGERLTCNACKKVYELTTLGSIKALNGVTEFDHIPDWVAWQRQCVKEEIIDKRYSLQEEVDIYALTNHKALYQVGKGVLTHNEDGFLLKGCDGKIDFTQPALYSHSLNADYFWYEIGDVICVGDNSISYYCFPKNKFSVAKTRFAVEELYKIKKEQLKK